MLILVIGDLHIPLRAHAIPAIFREKLTGNKIHKIFCTGNVCTKDELDLLKSFCPDVQMVRGEYDDDDLCETEDILDSIGGFKIGLTSSYAMIPPSDKERLAAKAREMDVDILLFGGGHRAGVFEHEGTFFVNPGSATGAFTADVMNARPSFVLIKFQGSSAQVFTYRIDEDDEIQVARDNFSKEEDE